MLQFERQLASMAAAVSQLEFALRESSVPVNALGAALEGASLGLERVRAAAGSDATAEPLRTECVRVLQQLSTCIESMQFYDRMVQQLALVQKLIVSAMENPAGDGDAAAWETLPTTLRQRLMSDGEGTVELF